MADGEKRRITRAHDSAGKDVKDYILAAKLGRELKEILFGKPSQQISGSDKSNVGTDMVNRHESSNAAKEDTDLDILLKLISAEEGTDVGNRQESLDAAGNGQELNFANEGSNIDNQQLSSNAADEDTYIVNQPEFSNAAGNQKVFSNAASCSIFDEVNLGEANSSKDHFSDYGTLSEEEKTNCSSMKTERNRCVVCEKDGQLLVCSGENCSLGVHEQCMGTLVKYDESGDFRCPHCVSSLATSKYDEGVRKVLRRKEQVKLWMVREHKLRAERKSWMVREQKLRAQKLSPLRKRSKEKSGRGPLFK